MASVRRLPRVASLLVQSAGAIWQPASGASAASQLPPARQIFSSSSAWAEHLTGARFARVSTILNPSLPRGPGPARLSTTSLADAQGRVDEINDAFVEARDEIEYAQEDAETVYFNESAEEAKKCVDKTLGLWEGLLAELSEDERATLHRSMGMKIEQLKAELSQLDHLHDD